MAKLTWDKTGERFYELGVDHGVLYVSNGQGGYENGVAWNGLTSVSESPEGADANDLWADNMKYAVIRAVETFGGTIEAYTYPDEFAECDGSYVPASGVYVGQQSRKPFGFVFRSRTGSDTDTDLADDEGYKLHIIYNATASPSERSYETINDSPDAMTFSWEFDTTPVQVLDDNMVEIAKPTALIVVDSRKFTDNAAKQKLKALEDMLFGTGTDNTGTAPQLPTPGAVIAMLT